MALAHCGCGQEQRSFPLVNSAASEHAWLQYFSPSSTGHVHFGWAHRIWRASGIEVLLTSCCAIRMRMSLQALGSNAWVLKDVFPPASAFAPGSPEADYFLAAQT